MPMEYKISSFINRKKWSLIFYWKRLIFRISFLYLFKERERKRENRRTLRKHLWRTYFLKYVDYKNILNVKKMYEKTIEDLHKIRAAGFFLYVHFCILSREWLFKIDGLWYFSPLSNVYIHVLQCLTLFIYSWGNYSRNI